MQWSLIAVALSVNALFGASCASAENGKGQISSVFEAFGYSPACVASALTSCEFSSTKELSVDVVDSIEVTKSLLQDMKSAEENSSSVVKSLLQEMKSERENSSPVVNSLLQEMKSEIKAIRQDMKSAEENSSSVVKSLFQEMNSERENSTSVVNSFLQEIKSDREISVSEIKAIRHEIKSEGENSSSVVKTLLQEIKSERENVSNSIADIDTYLQEMKSDRDIFVSKMKAIRQEIKSEVENSSSVVKNLLQEMQSEIGNCVSEMKAIRQDMKSAEENSSPVGKTLLQEMKAEWKATTVENAKQNLVIMAILAKINPRKNCAELRVLLGDEFSGGVQTVFPYLPNQKEVIVYCDQATDGGGWTVIQRRSPLPIRENFTRSWKEYVEGFGDLKGEFWLGLDNIHALTNSGKMQLRVDLEDAEGEKAWALYSTFHVGDAASEYVLSIGGYTGNAGDGMTYPSDKDYNSNRMKFSTQDNDNDLSPYGNCAEVWKGGWWFNWCAAAHLNGLPIVGKDPKQDGILWTPFKRLYHSMKKASISIRPVSLGF